MPATLSPECAQSPASAATMAPGQKSSPCCGLAKPIPSPEPVPAPAPAETPVATPPPTRTGPTLPRRTFYGRSLPSNLVPFSSPEGRARLCRAITAGTADSFFPLVAQLQTQSFPASCGVTTLAVALNAMRVDPGRIWQGSWRWYAESFLFCCAREEKVRNEGVTMEQFACVSRCNGVRADIHREMSDEDARALVVKHVSAAVSPTDAGEQDPMREPEFASCLIVSFSRPHLGQTGSGHFSPVAAYDAETDSLLVLDTARFKYPPFWVTLSALNASTLPHDPATRTPRGFIVTHRESRVGEAPPVVRLAHALQTLDGYLARREQGPKGDGIWSPAILVELVVDELGNELMALLLEGHACVSIAESCPIRLKAVPVLDHVASVTGWEKGRVAFLVLGCLATSERHGIQVQDIVSETLLGMPWDSVDEGIRRTIVRIADALRGAINCTSADAVER